MAENSLRQKRELYQALNSTLNDDDDAPDPGRLASMAAMKQSTNSKAQNKRAATGLARSASDSDIIPQSKQQQNIFPADANSKPSSSAGPPTTLESRHTLPLVPKKRSISSVADTNGKSKTGDKRRRKEAPRLASNPQQILAGQVFYFFPNNDQHPARKARIAKATEFGAVWAKEFTEDVTHIIVDKNVEYALILKYLKRETLPEKVRVVSEDFPAECISFRTLLDPTPLQFKIKGYIGPTELPQESFDSDKSLLLKPASSAVTARQEKTPRSGGSSGISKTRCRDDLSGLASTEEPVATSNGAQVESNEELDEAIRQAQELRHVPLDHDDELGSRPTSSEGPDTDVETEKRSLQLLNKKTKFQNFQDKFQCMQKNTGSKTETPNAQTIAILQQMADYYGQIGDQWRIRAYRKAIATLRNHPSKVWTKEEALALPQIGERLATKIEEIAFTNRLRRLENARTEPADQVFQAFMQIYGVGPVQASKWVDAGYKTIDEVWEKAELTDIQRIGIQRYEDFNTRIPRAEVAQHGDIVRKALQALDPAFQVIIGGSYRRGSETSGDIDCIITRPDTGSDFLKRTVLEQLVPQLFKQKFLVAELAATSRDGGSKWHGASQLPTSHPDAVPNRWRRIDFLLAPSDEFGAALIYFTGDDIFCRSIRLLAGTRGMRLNQRGLYKDVIRGKGRERLSEGVLVEGKDEKKIFEILGVPWRPPEHRIC